MIYLTSDLCTQVGLDWELAKLKEIASFPMMHTKHAFKSKPSARKWKWRLDKEVYKFLISPLEALQNLIAICKFWISETNEVSFAILN